jgi:class 3 adenylate cyclase
VTELHDDRRILAILFTDVVGYTALTERDENAAVRVRERHRTLVHALATQFEGELVDSTGDAALAIFPSALLAVDCALALQAALRDDRELAIRVGIHLGDVVHRGAEVIGEGVNVAARIRPLAEPGGICVSEPVYQLVRSRSHIRATSLGAQALKGVSVPVNVFVLSSTSAEPGRPRRRRRAVTLAASALLLAASGWALWRSLRRATSAIRSSRSSPSRRPLTACASPTRQRDRGCRWSPCWGGSRIWNGGSRAPCTISSAGSRRCPNAPLWFAMTGEASASRSAT